MKLLRAFFSVAIATLVFGLCMSTAPAFAETPSWLVWSRVEPKSLPVGGSGEIVAHATNVGDAPTNGSPIIITDVLPAGLKVTGIVGNNCTPTLVPPSIVRCTTSAVFLSYGKAIGGVIKFAIHVSVEKASSGATNEVSITGGGAQIASTSDPVSFGSSPQGFGVGRFEQVALNENGSPDTQAGSHPFEYTTTLELNQKKNRTLNGKRVTEGGVEQEENTPVGSLVKDLHFNLPPGLIGNPTTVSECPIERFYSMSLYGNGVLGAIECPDDSAIGVAGVMLNDNYYDVPLFNLVPGVGEPARFGFNLEGVPVILDTAVRSGGDYGVVVNINDISNVLDFTGSQVTFWGVPSDPRHDRSRGYKCLAGGFLNPNELLGPCASSPAGTLPGPPLLTLPTSCTGPLRSSVEVDSWGTTKEVGPYEHPGEYQTTEYFSHNGTGPYGLDGCNHLPFEPSIAVTPDGPDASSPTGLSVTEHVPQDDTLVPTGLAESTVKNTTVELPIGVQISPAGGDGLLACSTEQIGFGGPSQQGGLEFSDDLGSCPEASKVGTVKIVTPLLPNPLTGAVYLAAQNANPFGSLVAIYIVVHDPVSGVLVKAAGEVALDPVTGQLVTTFKNTPQLPYENLELHFFGSARAPLTTPPLCGTYTTHTSIEGWSGNAPSEPSSSFQITAGPGGAPCSDPQPFAPGFVAGDTNLQAGAFTPFRLTMSRPDADQTLSGVELHMPPGLLGTLSTVKLCGEPQAAAGTCGPESLIGETTVAAGLGDSPYTVKGGKVYITTSYKGAPYGLSIVNPAKAGPFDLGTVVVRAAVSVDPHTAALTIKSDPLPTILDGIPLQIQHVNVSVNREKFIFNPTSCEKMRIGGMMSSTEGAISQVAGPFQATNCRALAFEPKFAASTSAKTSRANGASLHVKLTYPEGPYDANIAQVKVDLPKQLPSRLSTLQQACPDTTFDVNPAGCSAASRVGQVKVLTPILPVPLEGPAYFVSHGGAKFPEVIFVLQGYGVTIDVSGETFINSKGITSDTLRTVPDAPFSSFELTFPEGRYSALGANANLCKVKGGLKMPLSFVAQDGAAIHQTTNVAVSGCPKAKVKKLEKPNKPRKARKKK